MITLEKSFDLLSNSLNYFFKEMCGDQFGEFVCGYNLGLKGLKGLPLVSKKRQW